MIQSPAGYQGDVRIKRYLDFYQAGYGVAMLSSGVAFSPLSLFAQGEQGGWYDPSDLTTLFQDAAGTTPVTAVEQPVGRVLDKSGRGNHLSQSTSTARPVLSARVNLLTYTEEFDNAAWSKQRSAVTANQTTAPDGTNTADLLSINTTANSSLVTGDTASLVSIGNILRTGSICLKQGTWRYMNVVVTNYTFDNAWAAATIDLQTGLITQTTGGVGASSITSQSVAVGNGFYRVTVSAVLTAGSLCSLEVNFSPSATPTLGAYGRANVTGTASDYVYIWGADLRPANAGVGLPSYQRVTTSTDYDTTGFPLYLKFDGTDDFLVSNTINPGSVDKAQVFAGVRKLSDAATAVIAEWSDSFSTVGRDGTFILSSSASGASVYGSAFKGTNIVGGDVSGYAAPITNVLSNLFDIPGDVRTFRSNGTQASLVTGDAGAGNFSSQVLYVGRRGGTSLPFNGHLYQLLVRFSATNLDAATIASTETWVNSKTRAY